MGVRIDVEFGETFAGGGWRFGFEAGLGLGDVWFCRRGVVWGGCRGVR